MDAQQRILGLVKLGRFISEFLKKKEEEYSKDDLLFLEILKKTEIENPWFIIENQRYALQQWARLFTEQGLQSWLSSYHFSEFPKKVGLILAGNIPMVGFHDVLAVILSGNKALIKLSSKDKYLIPFILEQWQRFSEGVLEYELVEQLRDFEAVIATGSNNTARYLEYYFKNHKSIIRKNRTSVAVLKGDEKQEDLRQLAEDIFRYFGLGCRNVTRLLIPKDYPLDFLFENFINYGWVINHNSYANNYDYNKAIYLLNQEPFWDNNFVMLKEHEALFSPLSVINFSRYDSLDEVKQFLENHEENIQCVVTKLDLDIETVKFGETQHPALDTYADYVDTLKFLESL